MGPLTPEQVEAFQKNPRFIGMKFPEMNKPETLEKRYLGKISKKALMFMKDCLKMDPSQRITASKLIQHTYFDGLRDTSDNLSASQENRIESAKPTPIQSVQVSNAKPQSKVNLNATTNSPTNLNSQKNVQQIPLNNAKIEALQAEQQ